MTIHFWCYKRLKLFLAKGYKVLSLQLQVLWIPVKTTGFPCKSLDLFFENLQCIRYQMPEWLTHLASSIVMNTITIIIMLILVLSLLYYHQLMYALLYAFLAVMARLFIPRAIRIPLPFGGQGQGTFHKFLW